MFSNLSLNKFEETQKIDMKKIICEQCNKNNKYTAYKNQFFYCLTCDKNLCNLCKECHEQKHLIIEDKEKNYICKKHKETFCR